MTDIEIDLLVTREILGWTVEKEKGYWPNLDRVVRDGRGNKVGSLSSWRPTRNLAQAWTVLMRLPYPEYEWQIVRHNAMAFTVMISRNYIDAADETDVNIARAICLAVLRAKGIDA